MSGADLVREARVFTRALVGQSADDYVLRAYARGHDALPLAPVQGFDAVLMRVALRGPLRTRLADAYARLVSPRAILRRKLALLLAILESSAPFDRAFEPIVVPRLVTVLRLGLAGLDAAALTVFSLVVLAPRHLLHRLTAGRL